MLADKELDEAAAKLTDFRVASEQHYETLTELVQNYTALMDDYKRLRSDYEEERDSRERYKQMARGQERNPFVLVLIDGDGYVFDDDLISNGAEGGERAARLLNDVLKSSLRNRGFDHCRIMVRVYANLAGLSKALSKAKLAGPEKRSLARFAANFTRSNELFDFVDAGELKEAADSKIRAMFRQFADNPQCRHIYFACCHDVGYLTELTPYTGNRDRITLVRTPAFPLEFSKLGMRIEDFPSIFRTMPLETQSSQPLRSSEPNTMSSSDNNATICAFYQKGICKYGKACRNLHQKANVNGNSSSSGSLSEIRDWRQSNSAGKSTLPLQMPNLTKSDNDFMSGNTMTLDPLQLQQEFATLLPKSSSVSRNEIPINKHQHRLDTFIPPPSPEERANFKARVAVQKLCNNYHLLGDCQQGQNCMYDHKPVSPALLNCLKQVVRNNACPRKGGCRFLSCYNGHICQKTDCTQRGGTQYCKLGVQAHTQPLEVAELMQGNGQNESRDPKGHNSGESSMASTSPVLQPRSMEDVSYEDALLDFGDDAAVAH